MTIIFTEQAWKGNVLVVNTDKYFLQGKVDNIFPSVNIYLSANMSLGVMCDYVTRFMAAWLRRRQERIVLKQLNIGKDSLLFHGGIEDEGTNWELKLEEDNR